MWQGCPHGQPARPAAVPYCEDRDLATCPDSLCLDVMLPPVLCWDGEVLFGLSAVASTPSISGSLTIAGWWETLALQRWHKHPRQPLVSPRRLWLGDSSLGHICHRSCRTVGGSSPVMTELNSSLRMSQDLSCVLMR